MSKKPWMSLYIADYLKDTTHLGALESGAYLHLIMDYWQNDKLPDDDRQLARIAKMTDREWKRARPVLQAFFHDGWKHKRVDYELKRAEEISEVRSKATAKREELRHQREIEEEIKRRSNDLSNDLSNDSTLHTSQRKKDAEADASDAGASVEAPIIDHRKRLFSEGLAKLAAMTGKGPDACRSFVGKCLKAASDDAIVVLGLIEDAERNQVVDPGAWISARLKPRENHGRRNVHEVARDFSQQLLAALDEPAPAGLCGPEGGSSVRLISSG